MQSSSGPRDSGTSGAASLVMGFRRGGHWSVGSKVMGVVLATTVIALFVAASALLVSDLRENRSALAADLDTEAQILQLATGPALAFDDRETAHRNLAALQARESLLTAALYLPDGSQYAGYARPGASAPPAHLVDTKPGTHIDGEIVEVRRTVNHGSEKLGTIYLRAKYDSGARIRSYVGIVALVMLVSLGVAFLFSSWLQRRVTEPLHSMAGVARRIVERRDYSLRAQRTTEDEVGTVVVAFNDMLDEVQRRTRALEEANAALEEQIEVRQATERALRESERLYRAIGESIEYGVWVCDAEGRNLYASDSFLRLTGITQRECSDFRWAQALHPDDAAGTIEAWRSCVASGQRWYREHRVRGTDGEYHSILAQGVPIRDEQGRITGWAGTNLDISRLKSTELALLEADRRKDEFLATLAHELRNPLAPIRHAVRVLDVPGADEVQRRWARQVISRQVRQMALLLDDLLDVSRITRGKLELRRGCVDLATVVDLACETARPLIDSKRHSFERTMPAEPLCLNVDSLRISQVIGNLLTNAAKYTDAGGVIALRVAASGGDLVISVRDNGIGLDTAVIPRLFTMFSQVESAMDRAEGGLGIGLALVKGLVMLHGGHVEAHSEGIGRGSEFVVNLPDVVVPPAAGRDPVLAGKVARRVPDGDDGKSPVPVGVPGPAAHVLIVDDNRDAATSLAMMLRLAGLAVTTAFSGAEAIEIAAREQPQAVLLDIGMPGMSGYEVARQMRRESWGRRALLVAITGWGKDEDKKRSVAAGFDLHMTKPVDPAELERLLASRLVGTPPTDAVSSRA